MNFAITIITLTSALLMSACTSNSKTAHTGEKTYNCEQRCNDKKEGCLGNGYPAQVCDSSYDICINQSRK